jgi:MORN repeat
MINSLTGSLYLATGDKYQGDWKDGKRQGKGVYHYKYVNYLILLTKKCSWETFIHDDHISYTTSFSENDI